MQIRPINEVVSYPSVVGRLTLIGKMADVVIRRRRRNLLRRNRIFRDRTNPLDVYDDVALIQKYRFTRIQILELVDEVEGALQLANRQGMFSPVMQVLLALRFYASGSFLDQCGEHVGASESTASKIVTRVTQAILTTSNHWIVFPTQLQADQQKQKFAAMRGFPNIFGCIDGTHIEIQAPTMHEDQFVNRKGYHSINVQVGL